MNQATLLALGAFSLVSLVPAQTTVVAPNGLATVEGDNNNTIPWWAGSATYQQVHNVSDMTNVIGGGAAILKGIRFRKDGGGAATPARTMDLEITVGTTSVTAQTATSNFASNLGGSPMVVLPYTNVNLPALPQISTPNPLSATFPFAVVYPYIAVPGNNLCYEMRIKNSTSNAFIACDAVSWQAYLGPTLGAGCLVPGKAKPAVIGTLSLTMTSGAYRNVLQNATSSTPAAFFMGVTPGPITLPGLCASLYFAPVVNVGGMTDAAGVWDLTLTFGNLSPYPPTTLYSQFVFVEPLLPYSLGLSSSGTVLMPPQNFTSLTRIYAAPYQSGQGNENATNGSMDFNYGLVTGFDI